MKRQLPFDYAFRNLGRSYLRLAILLSGSTLVVLLALAAAGFTRGMQQTLVQPEPMHENVILLGIGSEEGIERSQISANITTIATASIRGIKQEGRVPFVSPEIHIALPLRQAPGSKELSAVMRGVEPAALLVHPEVEIVEGRFPVPGSDQIMVGSLAATRLGIADSELAIGQTLYFDNRPWTISGRFQAPNTVMDAEIWLPLNDLQVATKREASLSCVIISLDSPKAFPEADLFAKSRLDLEIAAIKERDYYASIAAFYQPIRAMILITSGLIGIGALLGGLNTMYAAFGARVREIGMLQALGYTRQAIVYNLTEESLFAAGAGTLIGLVLGAVLLDGVAVRFSMGAFALTLDAPVMLTGLLIGLLVGFVGALPPAVRCLRLPITEALKSY